MRILGLTGGIASGKSTVAGFFAAQGARILDADKVGHELQQAGTETFREIVQAFGGEYLDQDGNLNRRRLGERVFADPDALARLNAIMHPRMAERMREILAAWAAQSPPPLAVLDAAVLFEAGWEQLTDTVLVVYADEDTQIARLQARSGLSPTAARARVKAQLPWEEKLRRADFVIDGRLPLPLVERAVADLWERLI